MSLPRTWLDRIEELPYCAYYCEENVWHAIQLLAPHVHATAALWILGAQGQVALWNQRLAQQPTSPVIWDYHVVALVQGTPTDPWLTCDFDSTLRPGTPLSAYLQATFGVNLRIPRALHPRFRFFLGSDFCERFTSDRRHMRCPDGTWQASPPAWPCIESKARAPIDVMMLRDPLCDIDPPVLNLAQMQAWHE